MQKVTLVYFWLVSEILSGVTQLNIGDICLFVYVDIHIILYFDPHIFVLARRSTSSYFCLSSSARTIQEIELFTALNYFAGV